MENASNMTPHHFAGAQPALFTSRTVGNVVWWQSEVDVEVAGWIVTFQEVKVLLCNREKKISGTLGCAFSMN